MGIFSDIGRTLGGFGGKVIGGLIPGGGDIGEKIGSELGGFAGGFVPLPFAKQGRLMSGRKMAMVQTPMGPMAVAIPAKKRAAKKRGSRRK